MIVSNEIMESLGFKQEKSLGGSMRWYSRSVSDRELSFPVSEELTLEKVVEELKKIWLERGREEIRSGLKDLLNIRESREY